MVPAVPCLLPKPSVWSPYHCAFPVMPRGKGPWVSELPEIWGYFGWVPEVRSPPDCRLLGGGVRFGFASPPCSETPGTEQVLRECV